MNEDLLEGIETWNDIYVAITKIIEDGNMTRQKLFSELRNSKQIFYEKPYNFCSNVQSTIQWWFIEVDGKRIFLGYSEKDAYENFVIYKYPDLFKKAFDKDFELQIDLCTEEEYFDQIRKLVKIANTMEER